MSPGYWFMLGGLLSFAGMGIVHKLGDRYQGNPPGIAFVTMAVAFLITAARATAGSGYWLAGLPPKVMLLAIPFGISAALALWLFQKGLRHGHIVTSWLLINLSTAIPTILSILIYREPLSLRKALTMLLILCSLVLLWWDRKRQPERPQTFPAVTGVD